jgi:hypothetical protein
VTVWAELKPVIVALCDERPRALTGYPDPRSDDGREPPFRLRCAAWAVDVAEGLHARFGSDVDLTVGALRYPDAVPAQGPRRTEDLPVVDPAEIGVTLADTISVPSGHTGHGAVLLANHTDRLVAISTNGWLTAVVVDPRTERVVGGHAGARILRKRTFPVAPGQSRRIPLLVGTASFDGALGYAVPPGEWAIRATITVADRLRLRTPLFPLLVS